ncbi:MAG: hypothetical protein WD871_13265 [Xanthobacteraceae bacterium]
MAFRLSLAASEELPPLGWTATVDRDSRHVRVVMGMAVESDSDGIVAGAWSSPFARGGMADAVTCCGSGLQTCADSLIVVCGNAGADVIFVHRVTDRLTIGNSLPLVLAAADDRPRVRYAFYSNDLFSIYFGPTNLRTALPMTNGAVSAFFSQFEVSADLTMRERRWPLAPRFSNFAEYRSFLVQQTAAVFSNASDPSRKVRYQPIAAVSAGYDAPASAVIARDTGCTDAYTFRQSMVSKGEPDDSGEAIARELGLSVAAFDTFAYRGRTDLPEVTFASAGFGGGRVHHAGHEEVFRKRIVVGGGGGDRIWQREFRLPGPHHLPMYLGGYSATKFFLELPALMLAVPAIGITSFEDIGRISRSSEMRPWSVGGWYDRPMARRLLEEAGVARGNFARGKLRIALGYEFPIRKVPALNEYLSPRSLADFERWFSKARPMASPGVALHNFAEATLGRIVWSKKLTRGLRKIGVRWPSGKGPLRHLRSPIRKNAFVFQWAVEKEIARYQKALAARTFRN